ncbi:MAG TPA: STAS domain-containing protein [Spirochaetota bacterium]|nr:STAS domain-containing protein [Spirochaetota bacterium]
MEINLTTGNDFLLFSIDGDLTLTEVDTFKKAFNSTLNMKEKNVIINLKDMKFMDSAGIGQLVSVVNFCQNKKKNLLIMNAGSFVLQSLKTVGLEKFFNYITQEDFERKFR